MASIIIDKSDSEIIVGRGGLADVVVDCAETEPGTTFKTVELASALLNCVVAVLAAGTELDELNTRVILVTTDPFVKELTIERL